MHITQKVLGTGVALAIAVGGYGCRYALREATEDRADRIAEDAAESIVDGYPDGPPTTVTITVPATNAPADAPPSDTKPADAAPGEVPVETTAPEAPSGPPAGWPAGLALVDGLTVESTSDVAGLSVVGTVAGDVPTVTEAVRAQLATAGFAVDPTRSVGGVTVATGAGATATVLVSPADPATARVSYRIQQDA